MKEAFLSLFGKEKETLQGKKEKREREKNPMFFFSREGLFFFLKRKGLQGKREKSRKKGRKPQVVSPLSREMKETEVNILPIGELNEKVLSLLLEALPFKAKKLPRAEIPSGAYNPRRGQYLALHFLELAHSFSGIVLGVTNVDIYAEGLNFIFGQAELNGKAAVISTYRLENADKELFALRMVKESVHELGHIFGLEHCSKELCVMKFSNCIEDTDRKGKWYCNECESKLKRFSNARLRFKRNACLLRCC